MDDAYRERAIERRNLLTARVARSKEQFLAFKSEREIEIQTARLVLRAHRLTDFSACAAMWADPLVTRYITGNPSSKQQTWSRLLTYVGHWALLGFGYWAIEEKATGAFVGELGFADFKRAIEAPIAGLPELGWALASHVHGRGYATEAVRAAVAWGDEHLPAQRTVCIIDPQNVASVRVAEKCGYAELQRIAYNDKSVLIFQREAGTN